MPIGLRLAIWLSAFFSPIGYLVSLVVGDRFHVPGPPDAVVASLFYLIPVVALLICGAVIWSSGTTKPVRIGLLFLTLVAMAIQAGVVLAITILATG